MDRMGRGSCSPTKAEWGWERREAAGSSYRLGLDAGRRVSCNVLDESFGAAHGTDARRRRRRGGWEGTSRSSAAERRLGRAPRPGRPSRRRRARFLEAGGAEGGWEGRRVLNDRIGGEGLASSRPPNTEARRLEDRITGSRGERRRSDGESGALERDETEVLSGKVSGGPSRASTYFFI
jgi:hypothetical protein